VNDFTFVPSGEQSGAIDSLNRGDNIFLTGVAGTGKTATLNHFLDKTDKRVAVTASTGIAATHLGGQTIHSWSGCGRCDQSAEEIANLPFWKYNRRKDIAECQVLVIDEISMLDGIAFELIGDLVAKAKGSTTPFYATQLIVVGDMGQLAPVQEGANGFAFETTTWWDSKIKSIELREVRRQKDVLFSGMLRGVRDGTLSVEGEKMLSARVRAFDPDAAQAVRLMTHNAQVDGINTHRLAAMPGASRCFTSKDIGKEPHITKLDKDCLAPRHLYLKEGARVMFVKNDKGGRFVNGTLGTVTKLPERDDGSQTMKVKIDSAEAEIDVERQEWNLTGGNVESKDGKKKKSVLAQRVQYPLRLAWAITIHKSQGMSLDRVSVDLGDCFAPGQAYVALSRARTLEGLNIERWQGRRSIIAHPTVMKFVHGQYELPRRAHVTQMPALAPMPVVPSFPPLSSYPQQSDPIPLPGVGGWAYTPTATREMDEPF
jgi:ATP-dependent DNA helicase PIF1